MALAYGDARDFFLLVAALLVAPVTVCILLLARWFQSQRLGF
jgi:hypothetical protein